LLEVCGNTHPRGMIVALSGVQNPAYRPSDILFIENL